MAEQHLKDYIWMKRGDEPAIKVAVDEGQLTIVQHIKKGFVQVDPVEPVEEEK